MEQLKFCMGIHSVLAFVCVCFSMNADNLDEVRMKTWNQLCDVFSCAGREKRENSVLRTK